MTRLHDQVRIEVIAPDGTAGVLDNFTSFTITNDITSPSTASFEIGDDGSFDSMERFTRPGVLYKVFLNDLLRLSGRVEFQDAPMNAGQGAVIRFNIKTLLSDAHFATARVNVKFKDVSIKDYLLELYAQLGYTEDDFIFNNPADARDQMTGINTTNAGFPQFVDIETHKIADAKTKPPETIYAAADRQLRKHGLMHWDSPDGKIVVSAPNDTQDALYYFICRRGASGANNNVLDIKRVRDWSAIPSVIGVFGVGGKRNFSKARVSSILRNDEVFDAGFFRPVAILADGIKRQDVADRAVKREMASRSKRQDAFDVSVDSLTWWNGQANIPFGYDTVCDVQSDVAGGLLGAYYIHRVTMSRNAASGDSASIGVLRAGIWDLGAIF